MIDDQHINRASSRFELQSELLLERVAAAVRQRHHDGDPREGGVPRGGFDLTLEAAREQGAVFAYGSFITVLINFLILAWIIFLMVKAVNNLRRRLIAEEKAVEVPPAPPADVQLLTEIRDLLAKK